MEAPVFYETLVTNHQSSLYYTTKHCNFYRQSCENLN